MKLKRIVTLFVVVALSCGGVYWYSERRADSADVSYRTALAERGSLRSVIQATGTLSAEETVDVGTQISGTINDIYVDYNDKVSQGQLIAVMDNRTQQAEVDMAKANVLSAKADLAKAQASLLKANRDLKRTRELIKKDLIARSELDADVAAQSTANADVMAAQAKVAQYEATLRKAEISLGYTKIYSPVDASSWLRTWKRARPWPPAIRRPASPRSPATSSRCRWKSASTKPTSAASRWDRTPNSPSTPTPTRRSPARSRRSASRPAPATTSSATR